MKKLLLSVCAFSLTLATLQAGEITKYINPFIGTGAIDGDFRVIITRGATSPFGMIQLSPDTSEAPNWGTLLATTITEYDLRFQPYPPEWDRSLGPDRHCIDADQ